MHEYMSGWFAWVVDCPGIPEELARARHHVHQLLDGNPHADDAALIVTELGTNAITHTDSAKTTFRLVLVHGPDGISITVTDAGGTTTRPHVERPEDTADHGRGLALVTALATTLTITGDDHGHTVTAEIHTTPATAR
ncbi:ATP-binding protein [Streptomyces radicis]|uniref:ATP-binding protein n=1 Tax=Streptomyces radicis TaxID=1750517 RepID=A0A3A9WAW7_9ACTN|nr:ATP-binding protein [Streptomyces radicis]RKN10175.1 ATP-binding protein [Streptomyces radicis]RKN24517.1 ATP-binding protein [Streptomyces radicis]